MIISTRAVIKLPSVNCTFHRNKPPRKKRLPLKSKSRKPLIRNKRLTSRSKQDFSVERKTDIVWWWTLLWTHLWDDFYTRYIETSSPPSHDYWWTQKSDEHFHQHSNSHSDSGHDQHFHQHSSTHSDSGHDQHFHQHSSTHSDSGHNASSSHDLSDFT